MSFLQALFSLFTGLLFTGSSFYFSTPELCETAKPGAAAATAFAKHSVFKLALADIQKAVVQNKQEHCISFGKDAANSIISSFIQNGNTSSGNVPSIANAFADMHNHINNLPPDAGDFFGLVNLNKHHAAYKTRFVVTSNKTVYALLVTDIQAALAFLQKHPPQPPAYAGGPQGFTEAIVDESRELKYRYYCTDEMVIAFILEKYNTGVSLLKQHSNGVFNKVITKVSKSETGLIYSVGICE